jgi:formamidopyrimidine-DNA glycosylase
VPELPDLAVVADAFHAALAGRPIVGFRAVAPLSVRATPAESAALTGRRIGSIRRRGKFLLVATDGPTIAFNPMLKGRFQLAADAAARRPGGLAVVLATGPRSSPPGDAADWTLGATWLPADAAAPELRYRDPSQMGKVYLVGPGATAVVPGLDNDQGPDADDPGLTHEVWRDRIRRHTGELKSLLRNQAFVAGIGNAYSDEILHTARLSPFRRRSSLAPEEIEALYDATRSVLGSAVEGLRARVPPTFETQVRDILAVHLRGGSACPRCGTRLSEVSSRGETTTWCRGCQA